MTEDEVKSSVKEAISDLKNEDPELDYSSVHERSTAHRLAVHMEAQFAGWNVDCEYDRDGQIRKSLMGIAECDSVKKGDDILPDIIVHHRGSSGRDHNMLVIELKKHSKNDPCDQRKLELLTQAKNHYAYQLGLYINIDNGNFNCTWYRNGAELAG